MRQILIIAFFFISLSGFAQTKTDSLRDAAKKQWEQSLKHDTTYVLEVNADFWRKLQYVVSKSNAEHLVWAEVNEYLNTNDPRKSHVKTVVDSVIKR